MVEPQESAEVQVAGDGHGHEIGHDTPRGQDPEASSAVADEIAEPTQDLFLHEGSAGAAVPHVDALVDDLRE